jgi:hypothetical protein
MSARESLRTDSRRRHGGVADTLRAAKERMNFLYVPRNVDDPNYTTAQREADGIAVGYWPAKGSDE